MSEFSESYHLKSDTTQAGKDLLQRANLRGFIFPSEGGWVTIAPQGDMFTPNERLIAENQGILVHFLNSEENGWGFEIYQAGLIQTSYFCDWTGEPAVVDHPNFPIIEKLLSLSFSDLGEEKLRQIFFPATFDEVFQTQPANTFAELIGLKNYSWISYESLLEHASEDFPTVEYFKP